MLSVCLKWIFHVQIAAKVVPLFSRTEPERNILFNLAERYIYAGKPHGDPSPAPPTYSGILSGVWNFRVLLLLANAGATHVCASTKCPSSSLCMSEKMSNMSLPALLLARVTEVPLFELPPGRRPWNHAQDKFVAWRGCIPVFWPQKMTNSCVLRAPGLQSLSSLAAAPGTLWYSL